MVVVFVSVIFEVVVKNSETVVGHFYSGVFVSKDREKFGDGWWSLL